MYSHHTEVTKRPPKDMKTVVRQLKQGSSPSDNRVRAAKPALTVPKPQTTTSNPKPNPGERIENLPSKTNKMAEEKKHEDENEGFKCLNHNRGFDSWLTDDAIHWALNKLAKAKPMTVVPPSLWYDVNYFGERPEGIKELVHRTEYSILPICEDCHWTILVFRKKGTSPIKAGYIDPFQKPIPENVTELVESMGAKLIPTDYEGRGFQKQLDNFSCGLWIIKYTAMIMDIGTIKDKTTVEIRKWLKCEWEKEQTRRRAERKSERRLREGNGGEEATSCRQQAGEENYRLQNRTEHEKGAKTQKEPRSRKQEQQVNEARGQGQPKSAQGSDETRRVTAPHQEKRGVDKAKTPTKVIAEKDTGVEKPIPMKGKETEETLTDTGENDIDIQITIDESLEQREVASPTDPQPTTPAPTSAVIIPNEEPLTVEKISETESRLVLLYPVPRHYYCVECMGNFYNVNEQGPDEKKETKNRNWITGHLKLHNQRPQIVIRCRICKSFEVERGRNSRANSNGMKEMVTHMATHNERIIREPPTGDFICGKCWLPHKTARILENHVKYCKERRPMPVPRENDTQEDGKKSPEKQMDHPIRPAEESQTEAGVPHATTPKAFQPLFFSGGTRAWYTEELMVWALASITGYQVIPPALWQNIQSTTDPLTTLAETITKTPITLLPLREGRQWAIILLLNNQTQPSATYLDPIQPDTMPEKIKERVANHLNVQFATSTRYYEVIPKQQPEEWAHSGPLVCIYASVMTQLIGGKDIPRVPTVEQIRTKLKLDYQLEQEQLAAIGSVDQLDEPAIPENPRTQLPQLMDLCIDNPFVDKTEEPTKSQIDPALADKLQAWLSETIPTYYENGSPFNQLEWVINQITMSIAAITRNSPGLLDHRLKKEMPPPQLPGEIATQTTKKPRKRPVSVIPDVSTEDSISWSYKKNPKRTFEIITGKKDVKCEIPLTTLYAFFMKTATKPVIDETALSRICEILPKVEISASLMLPFQESEVLEALKHMPKGSTPGSDGLTYDDWLNTDTDATLLTWIFQECFNHKKIPQRWKQSKTSLIYKAGEPSDPGNWRPIALMPTIYKLYSSLLNNRISGTKGIVSTHQKGFQKEVGTSRNIELVHIAIQTAVWQNDNLALVFLDLKNAFGSVPHELILQAMKSFGFPQDLRDIIADIYEGSSTQISAAQGVTDPIPLYAGIKQGDPLSPTLFNMAIEPLIRRHAKRSQGYPLFATNLSYFAYADDLILLNQHKNSLQEDLDDMVDIATQCNLEFKPTKCASLILAKKCTKIKTPIIIKGVPLPILEREDHYTYLGIPTGCRYSFSIADKVKAMTEATEAIVKSQLEPRLKLEAIHTFVIPRITYSLQHGSPFYAEIFDISGTITQGIRSSLGLPNFSPSEYIYSPTKKGCLGFTMIEDLARIHAVATLMTSLWSPDKLLSQLMVKHVELHIRRLAKDDTLAGDDIWTALDKLVTTPNLKIQARSPLARIIGALQHWCNDHRNGIKRDTYGIFKSCTIRKMRGEYILTIEPQFGEKTIKLTWCQADKIIDILSGLNREGALHNWTSRSPHFSSAVTATLTHPISHFYLRPSSHVQLGPADQKFIHAARSRSTQLPADLIPLYSNGLTLCSDKSVACPTCKSPRHLAHVLSTCYPLRPTITERHNSILHLLIDAWRLGTKKHYALAVDSRVTDVESAQRPDIVLREPRRDQGSREIIIIDITCPYEYDIEAMNRAHQRKIDKYQHFVDEFTSRGHKTTLSTLIVGAMGAWRPENNETMELLGIPRKIRTVLAKLMCKSAISWSRYIYWTAMLGENYHAPPPPVYGLSRFAHLVSDDKKKQEPPAKKPRHQ